MGIRIACGRGASLKELSELPGYRRTNSTAARVVYLWTTRLARGAEPLLVPAMAAAIRAGRPWLSYQHATCQMIGEADVPLDRYPHASI